MSKPQTTGQLAAALCVIGEHAIWVHRAWIVRNEARALRQKLLHAWADDTGEWFNEKGGDRDEEGGPEIVAAIEATKVAQRALNNARGKLQSAIRKGAPL